FVVRNARRDAFFDIERPRELMQATLGEFGDVDLRRPRGERRRFFLDFFLLARVVPQVELAADEEEKAVLERDDEGAAVELEESKAGRKGADQCDEWGRNVDGEDAVEDVAGAETAEDVDELLEGEWAENLVFDLDELWYLELHAKIIPTFFLLRSKTPT